jgi:hypothetical protein
MVKLQEDRIQKASETPASIGPMWGPQANSLIWEREIPICLSMDTVKRF